MWNQLSLGGKNEVCPRSNERGTRIEQRKGGDAAVHEHKHHGLQPFVRVRKHQR